jgi:hypothetical protein
MKFGTLPPENSNLRVEGDFCTLNSLTRFLRPRIIYVLDKKAEYTQQALEEIPRSACLCLSLH